MFGARCNASPNYQRTKKQNMETKITGGEWRANLRQNDLYFYHEVVSNNTEICKLYFQQDNSQEANAKLIADAGTTYNKCGLLPSELLKQRDELLNALQLLSHEYMEYQRITGNKYGFDNTNAEKISQEAINNAKNK